MTKVPQTVMVQGKRYRRVTTAHNWRAAKYAAKQERRKMNVTVVIRKDPGKYRHTYGIFNRAIPFDLYKRRYTKSRMPYSTRTINGKKWSCVYQAGSKVPGRLKSARDHAKKMRADGYNARVMKHSDGEVTVWVRRKK